MPSPLLIGVGKSVAVIVRSRPHCCCRNRHHLLETLSSKKFVPSKVDGASPERIFIGGLAKETTFVFFVAVLVNQFTKYFGKCGEIMDSVVMKDRYTGRPRGFGLITYADPSAVDPVI
ncbi:hypothetical protein Nepgr_000495 [Nepenthes gracilis]|uniref:RRM domain-containing protein n=1 Tax=Nepenthes gracilis TaxID=150966 RepID=A0AAD3RWI5_NEPGR|nr:hypothetical protein Nepgr_000495 [Nepenthes gracilis]